MYTGWILVKFNSFRSLSSYGVHRYRLGSTGTVDPSRSFLAVQRFANTNQRAGWQSRLLKSDCSDKVSDSGPEPVRTCFSQWLVPTACPFRNSARSLCSFSESQLSTLRSLVAGKQLNVKLYSSLAGLWHRSDNLLPHFGSIMKQTVKGIDKEGKMVQGVANQKGRWDE